MGKPLKENMTDKTTETETNDDVSGLKANNAELRKSLREEKDKTLDLNNRLTKIEQERDDAADSGKSELDRERNKWNREKADFEKQITGLTGEVAAFKIDAVINDAITSNKVMPEDVDMVRTYLKAGATMKDGNAIVGDKPLADHITDFFKSPVAQRYVAAPAHSGAGAQGSTAKTNVSTKMPETTGEWDAFYKMSAEDKPQAQALADSWGLNIKL